MGRTSADLFGIVHGKVCFLVEGLLDVMKPCNKKAFGRVKKYFFFIIDNIREAYFSLLVIYTLFMTGTKRSKRTLLLLCS